MEIVNFCRSMAKSTEGQSVDMIKVIATLKVKCEVVLKQHHARPLFVSERGSQIVDRDPY